ncbi:hypothetical protein ES705_39962 [subsurface metagenome]
MSPYATHKYVLPKVLVSVTVRPVSYVPKSSDEGCTDKANALDTKSVFIIIKKKIILNNFVFILHRPHYSISAFTHFFHPHLTPLPSRERNLWVIGASTFHLLFSSSPEPSRSQDPAPEPC